MIWVVGAIFLLSFYVWLNSAFGMNFVGFVAGIVGMSMSGSILVWEILKAVFGG